MYKIIFLLIGFSLLLSGCAFTEDTSPVVRIGDTTYVDGEEIKTLSYNCSECKSLVDCPSDKEYCESKDYFESLNKPGFGGQQLFFPVQSVTCTHYCVTQENLEKQKQNPKYREIKCTLQEDEGQENDFTFNRNFPFGSESIDIRLNFDPNAVVRPTEFTSIVGKGDFSGQAVIIDDGFDSFGYQYFKVVGIKNNKAGQKDLQGIIEFNYLLQDALQDEEIEKTFSSICKSNL